MHLGSTSGPSHIITRASEVKTRVIGHHCAVPSGCSGDFSAGTLQVDASHTSTDPR